MYPNVSKTAVDLLHKLPNRKTVRKVATMASALSFDEVQIMLVDGMSLADVVFCNGG
jgi:hypothetical protein